MKPLMVAAVLAGCSTMQPELITMNGVEYPVRRVAAESLAPAMLMVSGSAQGAMAEPALRIGGTTDLDTAILVMAQVCDRPYDEVKHYGAYGDPVWTDPATGEVVFWVDC
jgi:hypothetical protein